MMSELSNCPICGGLREDGVCDEFHPVTREERVDAIFASWVSSQLKGQMNREQD